MNILIWNVWFAFIDLAVTLVNDGEFDSASEMEGAVSESECIGRQVLCAYLFEALLPRGSMCERFLERSAPLNAFGAHGLLRALAHKCTPLCNSAVGSSSTASSDSPSVAPRSLFNILTLEHLPLWSDPLIHSHSLSLLYALISSLLEHFALRWCFLLKHLLYLCSPFYSIWKIIENNFKQDLNPQLLYSRHFLWMRLFLTLSFYLLNLKYMYYTK